MCIVNFVFVYARWIYLDKIMRTTYNMTLSRVQAYIHLFDECSRDWYISAADNSTRISVAADVNPHPRGVKGTEIHVGYLITKTNPLRRPMCLWWRCGAYRDHGLSQKHAAAKSEQHKTHSEIACELGAIVWLPISNYLPSSREPTFVNVYICACSRVVDANGTIRRRKRMVIMSLMSPLIGQGLRQNEKLPVLGENVCRVGLI